MLAGPEISGVSDDPEGAEVLDECREEWDHLPAAVRGRVHLACIPMDDVDENAIIVNALQRHAAVVVQKSLVEGFGLTVTEAMWKGRPVVASKVGGIQDQITDGRDGLLVDDRTTSRGTPASSCGCWPTRSSRDGWAARPMLGCSRSSSATAISSSTSTSSPTWWVAQVTSHFSGPTRDLGPPRSLRNGPAGPARGSCSVLP